MILYIKVNGFATVCDLYFAYKQNIIRYGENDYGRKSQEAKKTFIF